MLRTFKNDLKLLLKYSQLFPLCFAVFVSMLGFGLVMPLLPIYARSFGATGMQVYLLTISFAITRAITNFPGGWLSDKFGRKKPVIAGLLTYSVVMTLYGFSQDINQLIFLRSLQGVASGIVWPVMTTMIVDIVMPEDRGKALGLYEMMWFLGTVVGPGLGGVLASEFTIGTPFFVCGLVAFVSMILVVFTVQETVPSTYNVGTSKTELKTSARTNSYTQLKNGSTKETDPLTFYPIIFACLCIARFILAFSNSLIQPALSLYTNEILGINESGVGILFSVMALVTLLTTLPMGTVADNVGRKSVLLFGKFLEVISALLIIFSGSFWPLLLVMVVRGFGRAAVNPSITAMCSSVISPSKRGKGLGIISTFQNVGLVVGAAVGGFLWDYSSPETPFIACAIVGLIGMVIVLLMVSEAKQK